jgi:uncharacterized OsmC-like protein
LDPEDLVADVEGDVFADGRVLILRRVRVEYHLCVPREKREVAKRVHEVHRASCPVARSITPGVVIETTLNFA